MSVGRPISTSPRSRQGGSLPEPPRLIFFDTNVVQFLRTFGEFVYDGYLSPEAAGKLSSMGSSMSEDVDALAAFIELGRRTGWPIAVSARTLEELDATQEPTKR